MTLNFLRDWILTINAWVFFVLFLLWCRYIIYKDHYNSPLSLYPRDFAIFLVERQSPFHHPWVCAGTCNLLWTVECRRCDTVELLSPGLRTPSWTWWCPVGKPGSPAWGWRAMGQGGQPHGRWVSEATLNYPAAFKPPHDWATWVTLNDMRRSAQLSSSQTAADEQIKTVVLSH